jgi:dihydrofolate reductase
VRLSIIVAVAENGVIGRDQQLPWHLPDDLRRFKALTLGKPVLMGRRTFESIGRPLPGRRNLVLSSQPVAQPVGAAASSATTSLEGVASLAEAIARCAGAEELCVIGGAGLFGAALPLATHLYLTRVHASVDGDVHFPDYDAGAWRELQRVEHPADARHQWPMSFLDLERRDPAARRA